jgi:hypothetical protein
MKPVIHRGCYTAVAALLAGSAAVVGSTPAESELQPSAPQLNRNVIVILRDQLSTLQAGPGMRSLRATAVAAAQAPLLAELQASGAGKVRSFSLINAIAASVPAEEAARLAANPLVQAVVPDAVIHLSRPATETGPAVAGRNGRSRATTATPNPLCNTLEPQALQLTNAARASASAPRQAQTVLDGNGKPVLGTGVKVAFVADGLDTTLPGFVRPDGSKVFMDYQDFSGDPAGTATAGGEAFGDASSIAAQDMPNGTPLTFDLSTYVNPAHALPSPCNIRIRGIAPGASLIGLKVFSNLGLTTTSGFVQAIDWAVMTDSADVINESFGNNGLPEAESDPISLANNAAIAAGTTVVVSTGDGGSDGTLGSPASDANVIAAGATTQFRLYAQIGYGADGLAGAGVINNNISALSSAGFAQLSPRTVDVVAPGDLGWAYCSTDISLYADCTNSIVSDSPVGSPIQAFGGTSEAAPLTSGEAALVIQAYRSTHGGASPTPAQVKRIIMSTATDLGAPAYEQGAGLIDALAAVKLALSVQNAKGTPPLRGTGLLVQPNSLQVTDLPKTSETGSFTVTNSGMTTQTLTPTLQKLGPPIAGDTVTVILNPATDPTYTNSAGDPRPYVPQTLTVPAGAQHLDVSFAFQGQPSAEVAVTLVDPTGKLAAYSLPQGVGNGFGHVDVVSPAAGTWTAYVWTKPVSSAVSYTGPVEFTWAAEKYVTFGSVSPASFTLAPGASMPVTASFTMPKTPGDQAAEIRFGQSNAVPVSLRSVIPIGPTGGSFTGTLTGGNARPASDPDATYAFVVPSGVGNMSLTLEFPDPGYSVGGILVDPSGMELSVEPNVDANGFQQSALQLYRANPQAGTWRFILYQNFYSAGHQTSAPFTAQIAFNTAEISAPALPNSASVHLSASGKPVTVPVTITNTGALAEAYFADGRLATAKPTSLAVNNCGSGGLPGACYYGYLPTEVSSVQFAATGSIPIQMDATSGSGGGNLNPDVWAQPTGTNAVAATLTVPEVPYGPWYMLPATIGPYGAGGAPTGKLTATTITATMLPIDTAVSSTGGDVWADLVFGTNTYSGVIIAPGQSGTINITITPNAAAVGTVVSGTLFIDTFNSYGGFYGDEVVALPYSYTVVK